MERQAAWREFVETGDARRVRPVILDSWRRSRAAGVDADPAAPPFRSVGADDLRERVLHNADLIAVATPEIEWVSGFLRDVPHAVYLVDRDGIVLHARATDPGLLREWGLLPGHDWSERTMGTNGAGTALALGRPVAVIGAEHYARLWHGATCLAAPIRSPRGDVLGVVDVSTPVADAHPSQLSLISHVAYTIERELVRQEAEAENHAKDRFLATLAHELRNPLGVILTGVSVLDRLGSQEPQPAKARVMIRKQTQHLARLLDDLLDLARVTQDKIELRRTTVDLVPLVTATVEAERVRARGKGHRLEIAVPAGAVLVRGDGDRLQQVVSNIVGNAVKYTPAGGAISVAIEAAAGAAVLRVADNGIGIPPDRLQAIFGLFMQAHRSEAGTEGGLGIGLALVKRLCELHGGTVRAFSEGPGRGSEFVVRLPLVGAEPPAPEPAREVRSAVESRRVLLVEDQQEARELLATALALEGHRVAAVDCGQAAVESAVRDEPDVAVVDIGLPDIDGYEVARQLRAKLGAGVVLVAVTGYGQARDRARAREAGFDAHLTKPVLPSDLVRVIAEVSRA